MSRPVVLRLQHTMPGPADVVWRLITDWEHQDDWMLEASDFVVTSPIREGVGVEAEATVRIGPISTRDAIRVVAWEPGRRLGIAHLGWVKGTGDLVLEEVGEAQTLLRWTEELHPPWGPAGAIGLRLVTPLMRRVFQRDLRVLEGLVRAASQ